MFFCCSRAFMSDWPWKDQIFHLNVCIESSWTVCCSIGPINVRKTYPFHRMCILLNIYSINRSRTHLGRHRRAVRISIYPLYTVYVSVGFSNSHGSYILLTAEVPVCFNSRRTERLICFILPHRRTNYCCSPAVFLIHSQRKLRLSCIVINCILYFVIILLLYMFISQNENWIKVALKIYEVFSNIL